MHLLQKSNLVTALLYFTSKQASFLKQQEQVLLCYDRNGPVLADLRGDAQETDEITEQSVWQSAGFSTER